MSDQETVRKFWDARARTFGVDWRATLDEEWLRRLEIRYMAAWLRRLQPELVYDVGCGNGYSTVEYALLMPSVQFVGIDFSGPMIEWARVAGGGVGNCRFVEGDVLDLGSLPRGKADVVLTQRCLQNLPDWDHQRWAIENLRLRTRLNGLVLLMECSRDGAEQLNRLRRLLGRRPLEVEAAHNVFLHDKEVIRRFGARVYCPASTYMFLSKLFAIRLRPLGYALPNLGRFGYLRLYIIR